MRKTVTEVMEVMNTSGLSSKAQLFMDEVAELMELCEGDVFNLICNAYIFGYYRGTQAERRRRKAKRKS